MVGVKTSSMSKWPYTQHLNIDILDASRKVGKQSSSLVDFRNWWLIFILCASWWQICLFIYLWFM